MKYLQNKRSERRVKGLNSLLLVKYMNKKDR
jgi:hypothetical protein